MKIETLGHFVDGREVHLYTMKNKNGVQASFTDLGGVWLSLLFPNRSGKPGAHGRNCRTEQQSHCGRNVSD